MKANNISNVLLTSTLVTLPLFPHRSLRYYTLICFQIVFGIIFLIVGSVAFIEERGGSNLGLGIPTGVATIIAAGRTTKLCSTQLIIIFQLLVSTLPEASTATTTRSVPLKPTSSANPSAFHRSSSGQQLAVSSPLS